jgi:hypothetical protein
VAFGALVRGESQGEKAGEGEREMTTFRTPYKAEKQERKLQQWDWV